MCGIIYIVMYKRVLLKLSGEQLAGRYSSGIDTELVDWIANEIKSISQMGTEVVIMVGGGNYARGAQLAGHGIKRVTGDHIGMLATMMNALAVTDIFEHNRLPTRCLSNIFAEQVAESYSFRLAEKHLENKRVIIVAGGIGRPYLTTDTAAISLALEMNCEVVLKATKVDGVYDKDPTKNKDAVKITDLSFQNALENDDITVMDKAAIGLAMENTLPIVVFDAMKKGNIHKLISGSNIGTKIN
jgi:uridylate kinase